MTSTLFIEFEQSLNMKGFHLEKLYRLPDGELTVLVYKNFPIKERFRERFYGPSQENLIDQIKTRLKL